jgi:hypothetical protein
MTFVWGINKFHIVKLLSKGNTFNTLDYVIEILSEISFWCEEQRVQANRKLIVHSENACFHTATTTLRFIESNEMVRTLHYQHLPDLRQFDFFSFR